MKLFADTLNPASSTNEILQLLCDVTEYDEMPVRFVGPQGRRGVNDYNWAGGGAGEAPSRARTYGGWCDLCGAPVYTYNWQGWGCNY